MGRPRGIRNPDYQTTRRQLVEALQQHLSGPQGTCASFRQLAAAAGVSVSTLRHYFGSREGVVRAVLEYTHQSGVARMQRVIARPLEPLPKSIRWMLNSLVEAFQRRQLGKVHAIGIGAGLGNETVGPLYLAEILEPSLQTVEMRLARHVEAGDLQPTDLRHAALALAAPVLLGLLHQMELGGHTYRPLDVSAFLDDHVAAFVRAYGAASEDQKAVHRSSESQDAA